MSQPITRIVRFMSIVHETSTALKEGKMSLGDLSRATFLSQRHFPKFLIFTMASSGLVGFYCMEYIRYRQTNNVMHTDEQSQTVKKTLSRNEAMILAMIQDSAAKSWRENLNDAMDAQDLFMVGNSTGRDEPRFMKQVQVRSKKLIRRQNRSNTQGKESGKGDDLTETAY